MDPSSHSLQPPEPGPSRHTSSRATSLAVQPSAATAAASSSAARKRASHAVGSSAQQQQAAAEDAAQNGNGGGQVVAGAGSASNGSGGRDIYSHPAAVAYAQAHPRRAIPRFGPYLLLQTLGEGEFGKVKLGLHSQWGEEVAVKLIRRGNIDSSQRMTKVEREIEVLRTLKHPNIVRLYDVIETDKYIGIILEYASGGELFDHILAHRYLRERDASRLFAQLISGVWYIHQKKIVHRDLKLENLLLDRHRNVIITDFGFANRFEHRADDLMQTSCGSPCYAAPELVISEGMYVGTAVDIWSCGVILYAMLAGYLPFDDDPDNPEGDNINLLYRYIVNTPLSFPDYISDEARSLLRLMLVPDPAHRGSLEDVMAHSWLGPYQHFFEKGVDELESSAMEQHQLKRLAYQRQMKQATAQRQGTTAVSTAQSTAAQEGAKIIRSQSARPDAALQQPPATRSQSQQAQFVYETSAETSPAPASSQPMATRRGHASAIVMPTTTSSPRPEFDRDDPFGPAGKVAPSPIVPPTAAQRESEERERKHAPAGPPPSAAAGLAPDGSRSRKDKGGFRHTIQVEYGDVGEDGVQQQQQQKRAPAQPAPAVAASPEGGHHRRTSSSKRERRRPSVEGADKDLPPMPAEVASPPRVSQSSPVVPQRTQTLVAPIVHIAPASPPATQTNTPADVGAVPNGADVSATPSTRKGHKRGISVGKLFGVGGGGESPQQQPSAVSAPSSRVPSESSAQAPTTEEEEQRGWYVPKKKQSKDASAGGMEGASASAKPSWYSGRKNSMQASQDGDIGRSPTVPVALSSSASGSVGSSKKSRRNTLTVMVEPISRGFKQARARRAPSGDVASTPTAEKRDEGLIAAPAPVVQTASSTDGSREDGTTPVGTSVPAFNASRPDMGTTPLANPASSNKSRKVMHWFRNKNKADEFDEGPTPTPVFASESTADVGAVPATPAVTVTPSRDRRPSRPSRPAVFSSSVGRSSSTVNSAGEGAAPTPTSAFSRFRNSLTVAGVGTPSRSASASGANASAAIRAHHGAVDQETVTVRAPPEVMVDVKATLEAMGIEVHQEAVYRLRCVRQKRKKEVRPQVGVAAYRMEGSAGSNGVDRRGLPIPSHPPGSFSSGGMLRGLLMRRQSSQVSGEPEPLVLESPGADSDASTPGTPVPSEGPIYGERNQDLGDEIKFSIELTKIIGLTDTYSLDIRRLKGDLRSYRFLYDTIKERSNIRGSA